MKVIGVIPARYKSSRFPAKMLTPILGQSLLERTYKSAKNCVSLERLIIATDDVRIYDHATSFGAEVYMTDISCLNGTERLVDLLQRNEEFDGGDIFVNIQGDRPCLNPQAIDKIVFELKSNPQESVSTPVVRIHDVEEIENPASVKCVLDKNGYALYFSRLPIPYSKMEPQCYKHIGIYAFRKHFLLNYVKLPNTPLQLREDLEQLKILEHGFRIKTVEVDEADLSVDYPSDVSKVEKWLCSQNISL